MVNGGGGGSRSIYVFFQPPSPYDDVRLPGEILGFATPLSKSSLGILVENIKQPEPVFSFSYAVIVTKPPDIRQGGIENNLGPCASV